MERKIGVSTCAMQAFFGNKKAIEMAARTGATSIDLDLGIRGINFLTEGAVYAQGDDAVVEYFTDLKNYAASLGMEIYQTHAHNDGFKKDPAFNEKQIELFRLDLLATSALGAKVCVFHGPSNANCASWRYPDGALLNRLYDEQYTAVLAHAKRYGVYAAAETGGLYVDAPLPTCGYFAYFKNFEAGYRRMRATENGDAFAVCVDSGHSSMAMFFGNPQPADIIRRLGPGAVQALHLHDNKMSFDEHCLPMTGAVNFPDLFRALDEVGYTGVYNLEVNFNIFGRDFIEETATFSVQLLRRMLDRHDGKI